MSYTEDKCRVCGAREYHELTYSNPSRECLEFFQNQRGHIEELKKENSRLNTENSWLKDAVNNVPQMGV